MLTVRISQILSGGYKVIRRVEIPKALLGKLETYVYLQGGVLLKFEEEVPLEPEEKHFLVRAPRLLTLVKELEELLEIKFVEERPKRVK